MQAVEQSTTKDTIEVTPNDIETNRFQQLAQNIAAAKTPDDMKKLKLDIIAAAEMDELSEGEKAQIDKAYKNAISRIKGKMAG